MKLFLLPLLVLAIAVVNDGAFVPTISTISADDDSLNEQDCGPHETFRECGHAAICDATCDNGGTPPYTCPPVCVRRCICNTGFVRNSRDECVNLNECPVEGGLSDEQ